MKTILGLGKHSYITRVGIFLIAIALIVGMVSCGGGANYGLTISINPPLGGTATDLTNTPPYAAGTVVRIQAQAAARYQFVNWTAPVGTFANPNAATTTFTMPGQAVTVTANFQQQAAVLDHFKCYGVHVSSTSSIHGQIVVNLEDQFGAVEATVTDPLYFCNPVAKTYDGALTPISNPDHHLTLYNIACNTYQYWQVEFENQFGTQQLTVSGPVALAIPTQKENHAAPVGLDHFLLYSVEEETWPQVTVDLEDQWHLEDDVEVMRLTLFANPVQKTDASGVVTQIENPEEHLAFYKIVGEHFQTDVNVVDQFGEQTLSTYQETQLLGVPSQKTSFEPVEPAVLDHFKCYEVQGSSVAEAVQLEDQFGAVEATVTDPQYFCNPVAKTYDDVLTPISNPDHHLTLYDMTCNTAKTWLVEVDNQFGEQELEVFGPVGLAVPTQKEGHNAPVGLDHFLLYSVEEETFEHRTVDLEDQWHLEEDVEVQNAILFAVPAQKTDASGVVTQIQNPDEHLLFYPIVGDPFQIDVNVVNQFGEQTLSVIQEPWQFLAVPSEKISFEPGEPEPEPPGLDHFQCYWTGEEMVIGQHVYLEDQFNTYDAVVEESWYFCNPVEKTHNDVQTPISDLDHHLMIYRISAQQEDWYVEVSNQFGTYQITVEGPVALAVPTQKLSPEEHEPPVNLDHFLLYELVPPAPDVNLLVGLDDQFGSDPDVHLTDLVFFANPAQKTTDDGATIPIGNPEAHLLFYGISGDVNSYPPVQFINQFGEWTFPEVQGPWLLAVPSEKLSAAQ